MSVKSINAVENFGRICDKHLQGKFELEIIDINKDKQQAINYQIIALPTLMRISPAPTRTILGDLSDEEKVLRILNIIP